jgi:hypothetical protein
MTLCLRSSYSSERKLKGQLNLFCWEKKFQFFTGVECRRIGLDSWYRCYGSLKKNPLRDEVAQQVRKIVGRFGNMYEI